MRKPIAITLAVSLSALATTSAFALAAVNHRAAHAGAPAAEHVKPDPRADVAPPATHIMPKRQEAQQTK
jgi:hypothetical protein